jgi:Flp pilus assembly CpaF family ATPase
MSGEITLGQIVEDSLRFNLSRLIVGEVRGGEVVAMFQAMQTGAGSISTTHASSARGAIERLVTAAMDAGPHITADYAYRLIAQHIDLIVQVNLRVTGGGSNPHRERAVAEVILVEPGEGGRPATTPLWRADPTTGRATPATIPTHLLTELAAHGYHGGLR